MELTRDILYNRHRLSHYQINLLLNEHENQLVVEEKLEQLKHLSYFMEVIDKFIENDIWLLPLKGPSLSYRIYGDATCRISHDFDLLIRPEKLYPTLDLLLSMGYIYDKQIWNDRIVHKKRIASYGNQMTLYHPEQDITIEIHWRVFIDPLINFQDIEKVVQDNILPFDFMGRKIYRFTTEFELLYLIIHGGLHTWRRLKWLLDVREIVNRLSFDVEKFKDLTDRLGAHRMVGLCNEMLRQYFPGSDLLPVHFPVPDWFLQTAILEVEREEDDLDFRLSSLINLRWYYFNAFPSWVYKSKRIHLLFASVKKLGNVFPSLEFN